MAASNLKRLRKDSYNDEHTTSIFTSQEIFARYLVIKSKDEDKPITSFSPFVIEKQIEAVIGTAKSVKKLKNQTLLVETLRKGQTDNLKKMTSFFAIPVEVTEHQSLNSSKGIIREKKIKMESEENIIEYLSPQGVTHVKRFKIKKNGELINTNTLLLTFNSVVTPKTRKILLELFQSQFTFPIRLGFSISNGSNIMKITALSFLGQYVKIAELDDHRTSKCKNPAKCENCGGPHMSRSSDCEVWKKEKEVIKIKVTQRLTYPEARKVYDQQTPEFTFSKIVSSTPPKPETKTTSTQFSESDFKITESSKVIIARRK